MPSLLWAVGSLEKGIDVASEPSSSGNSVKNTLTLRLSPLRFVAPSPPPTTALGDFASNGISVCCAQHWLDYLNCLGRNGAPESGIPLDSPGRWGLVPVPRAITKYAVVFTFMKEEEEGSGCAGELHCVTKSVPSHREGESSWVSLSRAPWLSQRFLPSYDRTVGKSVQKDVAVLTPNKDTPTKLRLQLLQWKKTLQPIRSDPLWVSSSCQHQGPWAEWLTTISSLPVPELQVASPGVSSALFLWNALGKKSLLCPGSGWCSGSTILGSP